MADVSTKPQSQAIGKILTLGLGVISFGVLALLLFLVAHQFFTPVPPHRLENVQDVSLPSIIVPPHGQSTSIQAVHFDRFDFQALDSQHGLLFMAHPGPSAAKTSLAQDQLPAGTTFKTSVVVFDIRHNTVVGTIDVPFVHGLAVAPDLHKLYAADANDNKIYVVDELNLSILKQINAAQMPDGLEYDQDTHQVFISEPGANPGQGVEEVLDAQADQHLTTIKIGADVGHVRYDPVSHRIFVVTVPDPAKDSELTVIDPLSLRITSHVKLPSACGNAHGLALDPAQQMAFIACVDTQNLTMVDLRQLKVIGDVNNLSPVGQKPDIVAVDHSAHVLYVASASGIAVFDESNAQKGTLTKFGDFVVSTNSSHTIAVDDATHNIYLPLTDVGGRPTLRIMHFNPQGI